MDEDLITFTAVKAPIPFTKKGRSSHSLAHCIRNTIFSITAYPG